ncbi:hypothetical protein FAI40_05965 [Acetobacteraceae bacterium]|nr:hypothetical protein FAI40_05965 [Acetobacteraceae bacterium]
MVKMIHPCLSYKDASFPPSPQLCVPLFVKILSLFAAVFLCGFLFIPSASFAEDWQTSSVLSNYKLQKAGTETNSGEEPIVHSKPKGENWGSSPGIYGRTYNPNSVIGANGVIYQNEHTQLWHSLNKNKVFKPLLDYFSQPMPEAWLAGTLNQWYPPLPKQGLMDIEFYATGSTPIGAFSNNGVWSKPGTNGTFSLANTFGDELFMEYAITDRLSALLIPTFTTSWGNGTGQAETSFNDLPFQLEYNLFGTSNPSLSFLIGFQAPSGKYDNMKSYNDGAGYGAWFINFGVQSQWSFLIGKHVLNMSFWSGANQCTGDTKIHGMSTMYGTEAGFEGYGKPSQFGSSGIGMEYTLWSKKDALALDLVESWTAPINTRGWQNGVYTNTSSHWTQNFYVEPEFQHAFTESLSLTVGVGIPAAGRNSPANLTPQFAINYFGFA